MMADSASLVVRVSGAGVDSTAKSLDGLTVASGRADKANMALAKSSDAAAKSMPKAGMVAQSVGRQFQDMVVQIQGGQSAFVAIGQQVPQLLDGFGPAGAVAGLVGQRPGVSGVFRRCRSAGQGPGGIRGRDR